MIVAQHDLNEEKKIVTLLKGEVFGSVIYILVHFSSIVKSKSLI